MSASLAHLARLRHDREQRVLVDLLVALLERPKITPPASHGHILRRQMEQTGAAVGKVLDQPEQQRAAVALIERSGRRTQRARPRSRQPRFPVLTNL